MTVVTPDIDPPKHYFGARVSDMLLAPVLAVTSAWAYLYSLSNCTSKKSPDQSAVL